MRARGLGRSRSPRTQTSAPTFCPRAREERRSLEVEAPEMRDATREARPGERRSAAAGEEGGWRPRVHDAARSLAHLLHLFGGATHESLRMCAWRTSLSPGPQPQRKLELSVVLVIVVCCQFGLQFPVPDPVKQLSCCTFYIQ